MRFVVPALLAAVLVGCGTNVPLKETPVVDAQPKPVAPAPAPAHSGGSTGGVAQTPVTPVVVDPEAEALKNQRIVYFDFDSFVIKPEFDRVLAAQAKNIKTTSAKKVMLEGHADERGGREYNLALGQKRADAVRNALGLLGVAQAQMESVSFGKEKPAVQGSNEEAWAKNRRVEIRY